MDQYKLEDKGDKRILVIGNNRYETNYSKKIIELIIKRKGIDRISGYLTHKEKRAYFIEPLFKYLKKNGHGNLRVLEVGCSAGQFTELLNEQASISDIYSFDIDKTLAEITELKVKELGLNRVKRIDCFSLSQTTNLPYENNFFDIIIVSGVIEHLPFENRYLYVDEYYRKLKIGGVICFVNTPNRNYPFESHSIGLPFISKLGPQAAFIYAKLFGKLEKVDFPEFVRVGTGWRNASYYECLPRALTLEVSDISKEAGYGFEFFNEQKYGLKFSIFILPFLKLLNLAAKMLNFPISFFLPELNIVFKKIKDYESGL